MIFPMRVTSRVSTILVSLALYGSLNAPSILETSAHASQAHPGTSSGHKLNRLSVSDFSPKTMARIRAEFAEKDSEIAWLKEQLKEARQEQPVQKHDSPDVITINGDAQTSSSVTSAVTSSQGLSLSSVTVDKGPPVLTGRRSFWVTYTITNNSTSSLTDVLALLRCDDRSEVFLIPYEGSRADGTPNVVNEHISVPPGQSRKVTVEGDDDDMNDSKKPVSVEILPTPGQRFTYRLPPP